MNYICVHCNDWKPNADIIDGALGMNYVHGFGHNVKLFKFCPYCGWLLVDIDKNEEAKHFDVS